MMDGPTGTALLVVALIAQLWAVSVVGRDGRFDLLTRVGYVLLVGMLPLVGFIVVWKIRQRALERWDRDLEVTRAKLRGSFRKRGL